MFTFKLQRQKGLRGKVEENLDLNFFACLAWAGQNYCLFAKISVNAADPERLNADPDPILLTLSIIQKNFAHTFFSLKFI